MIPKVWSPLFATNSTPPVPGGALQMTHVLKAKVISAVARRRVMTPTILHNCVMPTHSDGRRNDCYFTTGGAIWHHRESISRRLGVRVEKPFRFSGGYRLP